MIICVNGEYREATQEEQERVESLVQSVGEMPKSNEERIKELETTQLDLAEAITVLYEGQVTSNG